MGFGREEKLKILRRVGGGVFFCSLFFLLILSGLNLLVLPDLVLASSGPRWTQFGLGGILGLWLAGVLVRGRRSVFLHEWKHDIVSVLFFGNRPGKFKIGPDSGHLAYRYTHRSAPGNAFIALAPYWLPLLTAIIGGTACIVLRDAPATLLIMGAAYGADLRLNIRDIHPRQTDITNITGGYRVGLLYIFAMNLTLFTVLAAWVSQGVLGLKYLLYGLWQLVLHIVSYYRARAGL